ncbi:hypothetical protein DKT77_20005 [Meridianimarinicoccus roseus]|uniref:DUF4267 domain-containing protein n=1 Tax=Meridianimarinicoccus roseus TaxID=2072018 RepID=A0A2V2LEE6_9RHOB|nr:hypothetical protein [Meridianimarinicoccus roseus]PWR00819.1 hypothetical protein DKT77_20005 [Meridianimarinicoccus roseus]
MLETVVITFAGIGALIPTYLAAVFALAPDRALAQATHRADALPRVMVNRYASFALFALAAALSGDMAIVAVVFAILAVPGLGDTLIYARAGHPYAKHLAAGIGALLVSALAFAAAQTPTGVL